MIDFAPVRSTELWEGKTPDTPIPPRVRARIFLRENGTCAICKRKLGPADKWICDHAIAICNGGRNAENNLQVVCDWCDKNVKTPADVAIKSKSTRVIARHLGIKRARSIIPGSKASRYKKKLNGQTELR